MKHVEGDQAPPGYDKKAKKAGCSQEAFLPVLSQWTETVLFDHPQYVTIYILSYHVAGEYNRRRDDQIRKSI